MVTLPQVFEKLKPVIALYEERKESIIVEGVRPSMRTQGPKSTKPSGGGPIPCARQSPKSTNLG